MSDYYQILGVSRSADALEVKKAFRKKAMHLHPDLNNDAQAHREFLRINEAYQVLKNPETRLVYDSRLQNGFPSQTIYYRPGKVRYRAKGDKYAHYGTKDQAKKGLDLIEKYFDLSLFAAILFLGIFAFSYGIFRLWIRPETEISPYPGIIIGIIITGTIGLFLINKDKFKED